METDEQQPAAAEAEAVAEAQQPPAFRLFSSKNPKKSRSNTLALSPNPNPRTSTTDHGDSEPSSVSTLSFSDLGLSPWAVSTCVALGIRRPTAVQRRCIPHVLAGKDVLAIARTGSGKTAAFALPILCRLAQDPYGVFALVITPSRELAVQLIEQFRAFGASLNVRCCLVVGGMGMTAQAKALVQRPHVVVASPGRIKVLMEQDPDIAAVFEKTKVCVLLVSN